MQKNQVRVVDSLFDRVQAHNGTSAKNNSQMDRLTAALAAAGGAITTDEEKLEALTARKANLKKLKAQLQKLNIGMADLYVANQPQRLKTLTAGRMALEKLLASKKLPQGVSKPLKACLNEVTSLREGVYLGESCDRKALTLIQVNAALEKVEELIATATVRQKRLKLSLTAAGTGIEDDTGMVIDNLRESNAPRLPDLLKSGKDYGVARVAILPIPMKQGPADDMVATLKRMGFKAEVVAGYVAIHNQLVVGINGKNLTDKSTATSPRLGRKASLTAVKNVMVNLSRAMGTSKLTLVSETPSTASGCSWFWVMPAQELNMLARAFPGQQLLLRSWGFAF